MSELEGGWMLAGEGPGGRAVRLSLSHRDLHRSAMGLALGRHAELAELTIDDPAVSKRHCRFFIKHGRLMIEDLHSLNGTLLNDQDVPVFTLTPVPEGAHLQIGRTRLILSRLN